MNKIALLRGNDLWKEYPSGVTALAGVTLEIFPGEVLVIAGPSGAGKSTLLHLMGGLDRPTKGEVILHKTARSWELGARSKNETDPPKLEEVALYKISESERAVIRNREIGFVFQFYHLLPEFTVLENITLPCRIAGRKGREVYRQGEALLERLGLRERKDHKPPHLSGGEQQRAAVARALMNQPRVLLCDEPTGNLDSKTGGTIQELLWSLAETENQAVVIVTHDAQMTQKASRLIHMRDGKIEETADSKGSCY